jgi:hypothetical protein
VQLIISDACRGLTESAAEYLPEARWQRCMVPRLAEAVRHHRDPWMLAGSGFNRPFAVSSAPLPQPLTVSVASSKRKYPATATKPHAMRGRVPIQCASSKKCIVGWSTTPADFIVDFKSALPHARVRQRMPKRIEMSDLVY